MKFPNYPILLPAFTAQIEIDTPLSLSSNLLCIPFLTNSGHLWSDINYPHHLNATFIHGSDYITLDEDGAHARLDVRSAAKDQDGKQFKFTYNGIVDLRGSEGKVVRGEPDAATTGFGNAFVQVRFETGSSYYIPIEDKMYVGSGRFIVEEGYPVKVEYKISEVAAPCHD